MSVFRCGARCEGNQPVLPPAPDAAPSLLGGTAWRRGAEDPRGETVGQGHLQGVLRYCRRGGFKETEERLESSVDGV